MLEIKHEVASYNWWPHVKDTLSTRVTATWLIAPHHRLYNGELGLLRDMKFKYYVLLPSVYVYMGTWDWQILWADITCTTMYIYFVSSILPSSKLYTDAKCIGLYTQ